MRFYGYIYCHTSLLDGRMYFGSCLAGSEPNIEKLFDRWNAGYGYIKQNKFFDNIKEIGFKNFKHSFLEFQFTADDEKEAQHKLHNLERLYIRNYDTINYGFNSRCGVIEMDSFDIEDLPLLNTWVVIHEELKPKHIKFGYESDKSWHNYGNLGGPLLI